MLKPRANFPPVRACLFDMDGLLLDTEDRYTSCHNQILARFHAGPVTWDIKSTLQGRPALQSIERILTHFKLLSVVSPTEYASALSVIQAHEFLKAAPLPGVEKLLGELKELENKGKIHIALATSSNTAHYKIKTTHLQPLFSNFPPGRLIMGDDPRIPPGRGKPCPDIYLLALKCINDSLVEGVEKIKPEECLVFEDGIAGVMAGRRAGMRVVWCPHPALKEMYIGRESEVLAILAGKPAGEKDGYVEGRVGDGWAEVVGSLVDFPLERYGVENRG